MGRGHVAPTARSSWSPRGERSPARTFEWSEEIDVKGAQEEIDGSSNGHMGLMAYIHRCKYLHKDRYASMGLFTIDLSESDSVEQYFVRSP
eukprot:1187336-Prorocentrum_minimum.AAC.14